MTRDVDFKRLVRQRMAESGGNYSSTRAAMLAERAADEAFYDKTVRIFFRDSRLVTIPAKRRARVVVLLELLQLFEEGRRYSEREVGELLGRIHEDVAYLRRELVDYRYLKREDGIYWVNTEHLIRSGNERQEVPLEEDRGRRTS